jgi:hypothetical protein
VRLYLRVYLRGLAMVTLVSCNTKQIASGHLSGAIGVGFLISLLWWTNSSKERPEGRWAGLAYACGAACGTALGYGIAGLLAGK